MFWVGQTGPCHWAYGTGENDQKSWDCYLAHLETIAPWVLVHQRPTTRLTVSFNQQPPTLAQRRQLVECVTSLLQRGHANQAIAATAFVTDSKIVLGTLTALNWFIRKPFPEKAFASPGNALNWLTQMLPGFDPDAVWSAMAAAVPPERFWPAEKRTGTYGAP